MKFQDKVAIVTGGASGMGYEMVRLFTEEGGKAVIADLNEKLGQEVEDAFRAEGKEVTFIKTDIGSEESIKSMIDATVEKYGKLNVLCNNAGVGIGRNVVDERPEDIQLMFNVNIKGVLFCCKYAIPYMLKNGAEGGAIVNTASNLSLVASHDIATYTATKGAVASITRQIAYDYGAFNIRVNAICPGDTRTTLFKNWLATKENPKEIEDALLARYPMKRFSEPVEQAKAAMFLASDDASFITGQVLAVDGGMTIW